MSKNKYTLHIYWDDDATVELRYFISQVRRLQRSMRKTMVV